MRDMVGAFECACVSIGVHVRKRVCVHMLQA